MLLPRETGVIDIDIGSEGVLAPVLCDRNGEGDGPGTGRIRGKLNFRVRGGEKGSVRL